MHDFRTSTALRQLADLDDAPGPPVWSWAIVRVEPNGRVRLPAAACAVLGARPRTPVEVFGVCRRDAMVLQADGEGRRLTVDGRGRLYVPAWMRRGHDTSLIVGTRHANRTVVLVMPTVLDHVGDTVTGAGR